MSIEYGHRNFGRAARGAQLAQVTLAALLLLAGKDSAMSGGATAPGLEPPGTGNHGEAARGGDGDGTGTTRA